MALNAKSVHKPFRKLERLLKGFPDSPSPEDVHKLRTHTRRIEAIAGAFQLDRKGRGKSLLKSLKPIRKAAGDVRDMDVLTDLVASLDPDGDGNCRVELMEHLVNQRSKAAAKLLKKIESNTKETRAELKKAGKVADAGLGAGNRRGAKEKDKRRNRRKSADSIASSLQMEQELGNWPKLTDKNLHPFRLKVKELRYVLQLAENSDSKLVHALGEVKDQIGLWHDWNELSGIAAKKLNHGDACPINSQIRTRTKQEFQKALESGNRLRAEYLMAESSRGPGKKGVVKEIHPAMVKASARLAS